MWFRTVAGATLLFFLACDSGPTPPPEVLSGPPVIRPVVAFLDPSVESEILIDPDPSPVTARNVWRYGVDVEADGSIEQSGLVTAGTRVAIDPLQSGPHTIRIEFSRGTERVIHDEIIIVNDPSAVTETRFALLGAAGVDILEGIVYDARTSDLYVADAVNRILHRLDPATLVAKDKADLAPSPFMTEGLSLAPDDDTLYAVDQGGSLEILRLPSMESADMLPFEGARYFVSAATGGRAFVSGWSLQLVDVRSGEILLERRPSGRDHHFSFAPDSTSMALVEYAAGGAVLHLLNRNDLSVRWTTPAGFSGLHLATGFSLDGGRVYLIGSTRTGSRWWFVVFDAGDGQILRTLYLGTGCAAGLECGGVANTVATSSDGRFLVFPTGLGAFFVDRTLDLPLYRTAPDFRKFCCNVAAHPTRNEFYFAGQAGAGVTTVRLDR